MGRQPLKKIKVSMKNTEEEKRQLSHKALKDKSWERKNRHMQTDKNKLSLNLNEDIEACLNYILLE